MRIILIITLLVVFAKGALAADLTIVNAMARPTLTPQSTVTAIYFSIVNNSSSPDTLTALATPLAATATIHQTKMENDVVSMASIDEVKIPAGATVPFAPGGLHIMLKGLKAPLKKGDVVPLTLTFSTSGSIEIRVPVGG